MPALITSRNALYEVFEPTTEMNVALDNANATMTLIPRSDASVCSTPSNLTSGYVENTNSDPALKYVTIDNVNDVLQLILPLAGIDKTPSGGGTQHMLVRSNPIIYPYRGQTGTPPPSTNVKDCTLLYARNVKVMPIGSRDGQLVAYNADLRPGSPNYLRYQYYTYAVDFAAIDYPLRSDAEIQAEQFTINGKNAWPEWTRNCRIRAQPYLDVLTLEGGQIQFAENPNPNPTGYTVKGELVPAPFKINETKGILSVSWLDVPADYVLKSGAFDATQIMAAMGKVNSDTFLGCTKETLLLREAPEMVSKPFGILYRDFIADYTYKWLYDIHMKFHYFNPPQGNTTGAHFGHNIFACKGQTIYLHATRPALNQNPGNPNNVPENNPNVFEQYDFRKIFQSANTTF